MNIATTKRFDKHYRKRILPNTSLDKRYGERFLLFSKDPTDPLLKDHALTGDMAGKRAFWITGDIRVVYRVRSDTVYFLDIGTHNQVYQ